MDDQVSVPLMLLVDVAAAVITGGRYDSWLSGDNLIPANILKVDLLWILPPHKDYNQARISDNQREALNTFENFSSFLRNATRDIVEKFYDREFREEQRAGRRLTDDELRHLIYSYTLPVKRSVLGGLSDDMRSLARALEREETKPEDREPGQWVRSEQLDYYAELLDRVRRGSSPLDPTPGNDGLWKDRHHWDVYRESGTFRKRTFSAFDENGDLKPPLEIDPTAILDRDQVRAILKDPPAPRHVYLLVDEKDHVFYVGKGSGLRVLSHEREVFAKFHMRFTNWHKLNKIASILNKGHQVRYVIDSWHETHQLAHEREEELYYRMPKLTNYGGSHRPSKLLRRLRAERGLDIG